MFFRFITMALIVLLSGCSALQKTMDVHKPKASVTGVAIESLSTESVTLLVDVKVSNPNSFALKTAGFDLDLLINQQNIAKVKQPDASLSLPAKGSNSIALPVTLTFDQVIKSVGDLSKMTEFNYAVDGDVVVDLPVLGNLSMPVHFAGALPIPKQPEVAFKNLNVDSIGLSGVKLSVDLEVTNPNRFDVTLSKVGYQLKTAGKSLGEGNIQNISLLEGKTQRLSIPLSISVGDMGSSLYRLLMSSDPVSVDVSVEADVDTSIRGWKSTPLSFETQQILQR
ncbi:LEA14-like dessication related protein [Marinomonas alcarazii]|uniref:LEA14-like dessication related protein n=1 Tax=Marinomonas alcarazii TaxID=491949 RepID=A0A318V2K8_9GAMM|nr:LEA type 2 family protein [Marinomonas alcarazii]PYF83096.1 LEA14-like dessication related protein [Marinomonas alcarazii]